MLKKFRFLVISVLLIMLISFFPGNIIAQNSGIKNNDRSFGFSSVGLEIGWYNPGLDYWKNDSEFKDADFAGAIHLKGSLDMRIAGDLHGQIGVGYWQETAEEDLQGFGNTRLILTGLPVSLDVAYVLKPLQFSIFTPMIGIGGEALFIQHQMNFEEKENPDSQWGSTILGNALVGFEARLSDQFAVDLDFQYKFGSYNQQFNIEIIDPENPDDPPLIETETESISLSGPKFGVTFKYLF